MALPARTVVPVLVIVVLAGCGGTTPGATTPATDATTAETTSPAAASTTSTTTTRSSTQTTGTGTGDDGDVDGPPGVSNGTVTDAFALTDAHVDAVANGSHAIVEAHSLASANGTAFLNASTTVAVASNPDVYLVESTRAGAGVDDRERSLYANGSIVARHPAENASYAVVHTPRGEPATPASMYPGVPRNVDALSLLLASSEDATATRVGAATYHVTAAGASADAVDAEGVALDSASNATLDLYVTDEGRVLNYTVSFDATRNGTALAGEIRVRYDAVGETEVEAPAWFREDATDANATRDVQA
ncbi:hypothetical protein [Halorubellus sp. PRR65]|uniref:hypothetical protein n=1 Tax=Halorubellus sp. PRR65 TaxID=3098148 RepID=UPI002B263A54|nr:hypothetical protein [Halorubellus sp. PRR65]